MVVATEEKGDLLSVMVTDQGPGVPDDFKVKIFERFAQAPVETGQITKGTGLGLAISKEMTERMGGTIGFESSSAGSCFWVEFPQGKRLSQ